MKPKFVYPDLPCRMVCIGTGPGPKNVLVEYSDGMKLVVAYATWKYKLSRRTMSEKTYAVASGIVQKFGDKPAVEQREVSGSTIQEFTIKSLNTQALVRVTLWPELAASALKIVKGAVVFIDGQASSYTGKDGKTYHSITARELSIVPPEGKAERQVENAVAPASAPAQAGPGF